MLLSSNAILYDCRKCSLRTRRCSSDSLGDDNNTMYVNVASCELRRRADNNNCQNNSAEEEMYTQLMFSG